MLKLLIFKISDQYSKQFLVILYSLLIEMIILLIIDIKTKLKEFEVLLSKLRKSKDEFDNVFIGDKVMLGNFTVECTDFRKYVEERIKLASKVVYEILMNKINHKNSKMENEIEAIILKLKRMPTNIEEMDELRRYCNDTLDKELA